jgi:cytochrome c oxidase assembly protein subunit 15
MPNKFSKWYLRIAWAGLVFIYLTISAGSIVRTTGSGMGCPDWPKCFGEIIPPTSEDQLPADYRDRYSDYRQKKIEKFSGFLEKIGFDELAEKIRNDQSILAEEVFNAQKTWIEYANRLVGFVAGNLVLILFLWTLIRYRSNRKLLLLAFANLILIGANAWFGSIVVATNLLPWTITLHMLLALMSVVVHVRIIRIIRNRNYQLKIKPLFKYLFYFTIVLTFIQILLGAQVRQEIDFMVKDLVDRSEWIANMEGDFYFHRSFSWVLLLANILLLYFNRKWLYGIPTIKYIVGLILIEFITGVLFSYAGMPAIIQPIHLFTAACLLGVQLFTIDYMRYKSESSIR